MGAVSGAAEGASRLSEQALGYSRGRLLAEYQARVAGGLLPS